MANRALDEPPEIGNFNSSWELARFLWACTMLVRMITAKIGDYYVSGSPISQAVLAALKKDGQS